MNSPLDSRSFGASELLFSSVQEDSRIEAELAALFAGSRPAVTIASGGDSALAIAARGIKVIGLDLNPAQVACCRLKYAAVRAFSSTELRQFILVDGRPGWAKLRSEVDPSTIEFWDRRKGVLRAGLNRTGLAFQRLQWFRRAFWTFLQSRKLVREFLRLDDPDEQGRRFAKDWNTAGWRLATELVFHPAALGLVFRSKVFRPETNFAAVMRMRFQNMLTRSPARYNYYAWETLLGEFEAAVPDYLPSEGRGQGAGFGAVDFIQCDLGQWLAQAETDSMGFIGLSNVPEFLTENQRQHLAREVARVACPGAMVVARAIFPRTARFFDKANLELDTELSTWAAERDRSAFCNAFQIYRVKI